MISRILIAASLVLGTSLVACAGAAEESEETGASEDNLASRPVPATRTLPDGVTCGTRGNHLQLVL